MFEVHTYTICQGWTNCWTIDQGTPETFDTAEEAQAEIDDLINTVQHEIDIGVREEEEAYDPEDYRIFDIKKMEYMS